MAESVQTTIRPDIDILADIHHIMSTSVNPPLMHDRHRIDIKVQDGEVTVRGYVKVPQTISYLLNVIHSVVGVKSVAPGQLYNDNEIRRHVGNVIPVGVLVNVEYGAVVLDGRLPAGVSEEDLVKQVALVPGVHRVLTTFKS